MKEKGTKDQEKGSQKYRGRLFLYSVLSLKLHVHIVTGARAVKVGYATIDFDKTVALINTTNPR